MRHGLVGEVLWHHRDPSSNGGLHINHHQSQKQLVKQTTDEVQRISIATLLLKMQRGQDREMIFQNLQMKRLLNLQQQKG